MNVRCTRASFFSLVAKTSSRIDVSHRSTSFGTGWPMRVLGCAMLLGVMGLPGPLWGQETRSEHELVNSIGLKLARIPAGEFVMGRNSSADELARDFPEYERRRIDALSDELPAHRVRITQAFEMGICEVTIAQFKRFVAATGYQTEAERDGTGGWGYREAIAYFEGRKPEYHWRNPGFEQSDDHPVVNVTWNDAVAFCEWLSGAENRRYRLPTEAEWEYACRAGTPTHFHNGNDSKQLVDIGAIYDTTTRALFPQFEKYAVPASDGFAFTARVGSFRPNAMGLFDMHGNVWEWCSDWYGEDYYQHSPTEDPQGPAEGNVRVRRGGSWHSWPLYVRSAFRNYNTPDTRYVLVGFRVVREIAASQ